MMKTVKNIALGALTLLFVSTLTVGVNVTASAETLTDAEIVASLKPARDTEYGATVGDLIKMDDGRVYQNYEMGYVSAMLTSDGEKVQNKRDVGGMNIDANGERSFLDDEMETFIKGRPADSGVDKLWASLASTYESDVKYDLAYALDKIYEKYAAMTEEGYNPGIPTDNLSIWDNAVIKLDFYDGDSNYGFDGNRVNITTIAYSFLQDSAYPIYGEIFNFYKESKAGSLSEPISDPFAYEVDGKEGMVQAFALGYIFQPNSGNLIVRSGTRWNGEEFVPMVLEFDDITKTEINQGLLDAHPDYGGKGLTVLELQEKFYNKYCELIDDGFNPGLPNSEGIFYWDGLCIKQAYVGSDGTGSAWGRENLVLSLNPYDMKVYVIEGEILNAIDEATLGLGTAEKLGYVLGDQKTAEVNGFTYYYQEFSTGTIDSIENQQLLTRFIKGKSWADIANANAVKPNNPKFDGTDKEEGCNSSYAYSITGVAVLLAAAGLAIVKKATAKEE